MRQVVLAAGLAASLGIVGVEAGKPAYHTWGTSATLRSASGDGIRADTGGAYVHGQQGVEIKVFTNGSGDLTVNLGTRQTSRKFIAQTTPAFLLADLDFTSPEPTAPTNWFFLIVGDVWSLATTPIGTPVRKTVALNATQGGLLQFGEGKNNGLGAYSEQVWVRRNSKGSWTVTTDGASLGVSPNHEQAVYATGQTPSPKAQYALPFSLEAVCAACESLTPPTTAP